MNKWMAEHTKIHKKEELGAFYVCQIIYTYTVRFKIIANFVPKVAYTSDFRRNILTDRNSYLTMLD